MGRASLMREKPGAITGIFPTKKTDQEFQIFKEIFIKPKENELKKV